MRLILYVQANFKMYNTSINNELPETTSKLFYEFNTKCNNSANNTMTT